MSDNHVVEILKGVVGELKEMARSETIVGEAITIGDKTVIPVVKISVGFGAGGGQGEGKGPENKVGAGYGGGGGGGAKIEPAAFIIMDKDGISLLPAKKGSWEGLIEAIPGVAKKISKLAEGFKSDKKESEEKDTSDAKDDQPGF